MNEDNKTEDMIALRGEVAALQYKRDRLLAELEDMKNVVRCKEQKTSEMEADTDRLREQSARQVAVVSTLKMRVQVCFR